MKTTQKLVALFLSTAIAPFLLAQSAVNATSNTAATTAANVAAQNAASAAANSAGNVTAASQAAGANAAGNVANAANTVAGNVSTASQNAATAATNVANAAGNVSANVSAAGQNAGAAAVDVPPGSVNAAGSVTGSANADRSGADARAGMNTGADMNANDPLLNSSTTMQDANGGSLFLNTRATTDQIRSAAFETRDNIVAGVEARIDHANQFVANLRSRTSDVHQDVNNRVMNAIQTARQREAQVRSSLREVRLASREKFAEAQRKLASDYQAYAQAVAQVEAAGSANTSVKP